MLYRVLLTILLTAFAAQVAFAQVPPSKAYVQAISATATQPTAESVELQAAHQQVKLLETQLQITKDFQSAILDTIYWALGGVFLALSLVFGFSWFTNFRLYDRDKQALHADLQSRTDAALKELQAEVSRAGLSVDRRLDEKLAEFTRSTEFQVENAQERLKTDSQASIQAIERSHAGIQRAILRLQVRTEPDLTQRLVLAQRLLYYTADAAPDEVPDVISSILRAIEDGAKLTPREVSSLNSTLDKVKPEHAAFANKLRERIVSSSTT
jgi:hypothetical protein